MDGVLAATLAAHQLTAGAKALEGRLRLPRGDERPTRPEKISVGLGQTWNLANNGHKLYPSGSLTHPMIDGVIALIAENDVAQVMSLMMFVPPAPPLASPTSRSRPPRCRRSSTCGTVRPQQPSSAGCVRGVGQAVRPDIVDLRDRVKVVSDPGAPQQDADVEITLASAAARQQAATATPSAPLNDDELDAKFRELVGPVLGPERTERLLATCWGLTT